MLQQHQLGFAYGYLKEGAKKGYWKMKDFNGLTEIQIITIAESMFTWEEKNTKGWTGKL